MRNIFTLLILLFISATSYSQVSDFITVKKRNNRTVRSYFPGSTISCQTVYGNYIGGVVEAVKNDSIFVREYDIRAVPNMVGLAKIDAVGSNVIGLHYKDLEMFEIRSRESFGFVKNGSIFMIGGLGYVALNLINGKYLDESITGPKNRKSFGIALGVAAAGFVLNRLHKYNSTKKNKYRVEYIRMTGPQRLRGF